MKIGVVGHGSIGSRHANNLAALGHDVLVYDPISRRDVPYEKDIYDQCESVVIANPTMFHFASIRAAAERGRNMLIEKPIARSDKGLRELLDLAASTDTIVMVGCNLRFHPCVQQAQQWIIDGQIGKPRWASFVCANDGQKYINDGVILNTGAHEVDLALHLFGPAQVVSANARNGLRVGIGDSDDNAIPIQCDDIADFVLEHESGCRSSFHLDIVTPNDIREAWIVGEKNIGIDFLGRRNSLGSVSTGHKGSWDDDYFAEVSAFIERIEGKAVPGATGEDGLATLKVLLEVRRMAGLA